MLSARPSSVSTMPVPDRHDPGPTPYYERLPTPQACDWVVRCDDCQALVTQATWHRLGGCQRCGHRQLREVRTLSVWEWLRIRFGLLDFPHRREFLAEFRR